MSFKIKNISDYNDEICFDFILPIEAEDFHYEFAIEGVLEIECTIGTDQYGEFAADDLEFTDITLVLSEEDKFSLSNDSSLSISLNSNHSLKECVLREAEPKISEVINIP